MIQIYNISNIGCIIVILVMQYSEESTDGTQGGLLFACADLLGPGESIQQMMAECLRDNRFQCLYEPTYFSAEGRCVAGEYGSGEGTFSMECNQRNQIVINSTNEDFKFWMCLTPGQSVPMRTSKDYKFGTKVCTLYDLYDYYMVNSQTYFAGTSKITTMCAICKQSKQTRKNPFVHLCKCKKYIHLECIRKQVRSQEDLIITSTRNTMHFKRRRHCCLQCKDTMGLEAQRDNERYPIIDYKSVFSQNSLRFSEFKKNPSPLFSFVVFKSKAVGAMQENTLDELIVVNIMDDQTASIGSQQPCDVVVEADRISECNTLLLSRDGRLGLTDNYSQHGTYVQVHPNQTLYFEAKQGLLIEYYHKPTHERGIYDSRFIWFPPADDQKVYSFTIKDGGEQQRTRGKPQLAIDVYQTKITVPPITDVKKLMQCKKGFINVDELSVIPPVNRSSNLQWLQRHFALDPDDSTKAIIKKDNENENFWIALDQNTKKLMHNKLVFKVGQKQLIVQEIFDATEINNRDRTVDVMNWRVYSPCNFCRRTYETQLDPLVKYCDCLEQGTYAHLSCLGNFAQSHLTVFSTPNGNYIRFNIKCNKCSKQIREARRNSASFSIINYMYIFFNYTPQKLSPSDPQKTHKRVVDKKSKFLILRSEIVDDRNRLMSQLFIVNVKAGHGVQIGDDSSCDINIPKLCLDRFHSEIWNIENKLYIYDKNSDHGTYFLMNSCDKVEFGDIDGVFIQCEFEKKTRKNFIWLRPKQRTPRGQDPTLYRLTMKYK